MPTGFDELQYINRLEEEIKTLYKRKDNIKSIIKTFCRIRNENNKLYYQIKKLKSQIKRYKRLSLKDSLTKLWNERKLKKDLKRYCEIQGRSKIKFTIALIDIDNFKQYNDKYGHDYGNKILKKVAKILRNSVRKYENVYRLGSGADEFIVIFSHSKKVDKVIERIREKLKRQKISISVGYDILSKNILKNADKRMYAEKRSKNM